MKRRKKATYRTSSHAEDALWAVANARGLDEEDFTIRYCSICQGWHIFMDDGNVHSCV